MSLKVMDGARTIDGANIGGDLSAENVAASTVNATSVDMSSPGHHELLVAISCGVLTGTGTLAVFVQESNEAAANFTNIASAIQSFAATNDNTSKWISVDWKKPDRKRYARVVATTALNSTVYSALTLRVQPRQQVTIDGAMVAV